MEGLEMNRFYYCSICKRLVYALDEKQTHMTCCGKAMTKLEANVTDAANEKHVPVVNVNGNVCEVVIGEVIHPMTEAHYIQVIALETNKAMHIKELSYTDEPKATFALLEDEKVIEAYEFCNLHMLWKKAN